MQSLTGLLLIVFVLLSATALIRNYLDIYKTLIIAPTIISIFCFVWVEVVSQFQILGERATVLTLSVFALFALLINSQIYSGLKLIWHDNKFAFKILFSGNKDLLSNVMRVCLSISTASALIALVVSLISVPNNWDSTTYHLPRIMHWIQNSGVQFYPTNVIRQLTSPNLTEYLQLIVFAATGSDSFLNLVQFGAFALSISSVAAISWIISRNHNVVGFAVSISIATPIALAEATTTQVDLITCLWVMLSLLLVVGTSYQQWELRLSIFWFGALVLLSVATKPTAILEIIPVGVWLLFIGFKRNQPFLGKQLKFGLNYLFITVVGFTLGLLPQALRTYQFSGQLIDGTGGIPNSEEKLTVSTLGVDVTLSNFARYFVSNLGIPDAASGFPTGEHFNNFMNSLVSALIEAFGIDWSDPNAMSFGQIARVSYGRSEDVASNFLQFFIGFVAVVAILLFRRKIGLSVNVLVLAVIPIAMMIAISSVLTWNVWTNRFIIPVFMTLSIVLALLTVQLCTKSNWLLRTLGAGIFGCIFINSVFSIVFISTLSTRPLIPLERFVELTREQKYFYGVDPAISEEYLSAVDSVNKLPPGSRVGVNFSTESLEFQLWALANIDFKYEFVVFPKRIDGLDQLNVEVDAIVCFPGCDPLKFEELQIINIGK